MTCYAKEGSLVQDLIASLVTGLCTLGFSVSMSRLCAATNAEKAGLPLSQAELPLLFEPHSSLPRSSPHVSHPAPPRIACTDRTVYRSGLTSNLTKILCAEFAGRQLTAELLWAVVPGDGKAHLAVLSLPIASHVSISAPPLHWRETSFVPDASGSASIRRSTWLRSGRSPYPDHPWQPRPEATRLRKGLRDGQTRQMMHCKSISDLHSITPSFPSSRYFRFLAEPQRHSLHCGPRVRCAHEHGRRLAPNSALASIRRSPQVFLRPIGLAALHEFGQKL